MTRSLALLALASRLAMAQHTDAARLVAQARAGTERYHNSDAAVADGFKRVGVEFPAMGEHWVSFPRILENRFEPSRPSVLIYINNHGRRELAGVGYTALLKDGEQPPKTAARIADWHEHNGSVIDESLPGHGSTSHETMLGSSGGPGATRLAILHVWAWRANPAGSFVTDNWSLPLVRAGIAGRTLDLASIRGLALAEDSASYYEQTLNTALAANDAESARIREVVGEARRAARTALERHPASDAGLAAAWSSLWSELAGAFPARTRDLRSIRAKL